MHVNIFLCLEEQWIYLGEQSICLEEQCMTGYSYISPTVWLEE